eukprot:TRINITY_DN74156_c0_g1_i1.p1 TRINITY_DN74156_c0_g1~~TRINITY_DN74156_c0_g1_i1.p1  ORF type:complete len:187 (-),score=18.52 TRINITY_DN74156_c0_g1_i1:141-641(-)
MLPEEASGRDLLVWVSYLVDPCRQDEPDSVKNAWLSSPGKIVAHGPHTWHQGDALLQPIFASHSRARHAERRGLLMVLQQLLAGGAAPGHRPTGNARLFASHTPCISCLAVFSQFKALYPRIRLNIAFDTWQETRRRVIRLLPEQADSVQCGRESARQDMLKHVKH